MPLTKEDIAGAYLTPADIEVLGGAPEPGDDDGGDGLPPAYPNELPASMMPPTENFDDDGEGDDPPEDEPAPGDSEEPPEEPPPEEPAPALSFTQDDWDKTDQALKSLQHQEQELQASYDDGDIDDEELGQRRAELREAQTAALRQQAKMEVELSAHNEVMTRQWDAALDRFEALGEPQKQLVTDPARLDMFNAEVESVYRAKPGKGYDWVLRTAYNRLSAMDPDAYPALDSKPPPKKEVSAKEDDPPPKKPAAAAKNRDVPTTLGDLPQAADATGNAKWERLDRLNPAQLTDVFATMTDAEVDAYMEHAQARG